MYQLKLLPTSTRHGDISNQFFQKSTIGFKCYRRKLEKSLLIYILKVNYNNTTHIICIPLVKLVDIRYKFCENLNFKANIPEHQITK